MYALVTSQGTAAAETGLCNECDSIYNRAELEFWADKDAREDGIWEEVTGNAEIFCQFCGHRDKTT